MSIIEAFIDSSQACKNATLLFSLYSDTLRKYGFDRVVYSFLTDHPLLDEEAQHGILTTYPMEWMEHYAENNLIADDPVPKMAFRQHSPFTWKDVPNLIPMDRAAHHVMAEAHEAGLKDGVGIPLFGPCGEIAGVGVASTQGGVDTDSITLSRLRILSVQFHAVYTDLIRKESPYKAIHLTPREKEILSWCAEGKSVSVVAEILGLSDDGIKFHLKHIYQKLRACDRVTAVVKALRYGLISPSCIK